MSSTSDRATVAGRGEVASVADVVRVRPGAASWPYRGRRPRRIVLVVACSHRKRVEVPVELRLGSLAHDAAGRAVVWRDRLEKVQSETVPACDLYMGDHWRAAREAFAAAARYTPRAELWVLSAGYGLIMSRTAIKPYSATFASGSTDSVWRGPRDGTRKACLNRWWQSLPSQSTIAELIRGDATVLVAAGASYVDAISDELTKARRSGAADDNLFIVSAGSPPDGAFLPASGRLRSAVGGTDSSLNARLLALLATTAGRHCFRRDAMVAEFARLAGRTSSARRVAGRSAPDDELVRQIVAIRRTRPAASRTYALRELRSAGIACEHSRFASLWNRVSADGTAG